MLSDPVRRSKGRRAVTRPCALYFPRTPSQFSIFLSLTISPHLTLAPSLISCPSPRSPPMSDSLIRALPDLVIGVRRDGVILAVNAGHGVGDLKPAGDSIGKHLAEIWPESVAHLANQL